MEVTTSSGATATEAIYVDGDKDNKLTGLGGWASIICSWVY